MSVRIGWGTTRPKERKPGHYGGGLWLFQYLKTRQDRGRQIVVGVLSYNRRDLEQLRDREVALDVRVIGWLRIADDVDPTLASAVIGRARVTGWLLAPPDVKRVVERATV